MISFLDTSIAAALPGRHPAGVVRRSHPLSQGAAERLLCTARQASRGSRCGSGDQPSGIADCAGTCTFSEHSQTLLLMSRRQWFILSAIDADVASLNGCRFAATASRARFG